MLTGITIVLTPYYAIFYLLFKVCVLMNIVFVTSQTSLRPSVPNKLINYFGLINVLLVVVYS